MNYLANYMTPSGNITLWKSWFCWWPSNP